MTSAKTPSAAKTDASVMRSLKRGLIVLAKFAVDRPEWSLTEISRETGLHVATTHRILRTLESEGFVAQNGSTGKYHLGPAAVRMGYLVQDHAQLARIARPHLERLAEVTRETADLVVERDGFVFVIDEILTTNPFKPALPVGRTVEGLAKASAKLFLALKPPKLRAELTQGRLVARTTNTITDPFLFEQEMLRIAEQNLAIDAEEDALGICAIALAFRDGSGGVRGAFQLVVPKERFGPGEIETYARALREIAADFSAVLGHGQS